MKISKRMRAAAFLLACAVMLVFFLSIAYVAIEADHDCAGEDCGVCYQIALCEIAINQLSLGVKAAAYTASATFVVFNAVRKYTSVMRCDTLITLKVKLTA